ncbi:hypothetical protein HYC85_002816 [Camellia sinensis]|uniref:Sieve element occlusion N-terminal domain-containing protein n=1 Tax=Camellia sinensis TaxID=4442 RepID=A0A7J7IAI9_CAMSI|nr:hypothetical protein HYC85_002816 [Camellia sinensis]
MAMSKMTPGSMQQLIKGDRSMLMSSDDNVLMKQIQGTHNPDGREIDVKPILDIVEDILSRSTMQVETSIVPRKGVQGHMETLEEKGQQAGVINMLEALSFIIDRLSSEIAYKCLGGMDGHQITVSLFTVLSNYSWEAKLVLALAAFALNYGEFWLLAQIYTSNQLAKSMALLKQLPVIMEHSGPLKSRFDALNTLITAMLDLTRCIVQLKDIPSSYVTQEVPALSAAIATIPTAVYWTVRGIVACATQITSLTSMGFEFVTSATEAWELSTLAHKINSIHDHLKKQLELCFQLIEEKRSLEAYETLVRLMEMIHLDNMKVLRALIYAKDDLLPLSDGSAKRRVSLEVLRRKNVLLLISDLDISMDELSILEQIYNDSRHQGTRLDHLYEMVWIPVVDRSVQWTDPMQKQFESLQSTMPWYTVHHPSLIDRVVIRFIREKWHFRNKPILVVLDPQGKVVSPNAIHMMWIWGSNAFPFTSAREEALWREETWKIELLGMTLSGYEDSQPEQLRLHVTRASLWRWSMWERVAKGSKLGESFKPSTTIKWGLPGKEPMIWFFWTRLESMLFSKIQLGRVDDYDPMMQEIKKLLSYDKSGGWAVLCRGSEVVVNGHGTTVLPTLVEYEDIWKINVPTNGFDKSFKDHHDKLHGITHPCCRFEFPSVAGRIPESMKCPECLRVMEKHITFICCHDDSATTNTNFYGGITY